MKNNKPSEWTKQDLGVVTCHKRTKDQTFLEMCEEFMGTRDPKELVKYSFTLPQIEEMTKEPEKYGLRTDTWTNFFLVPNKEGGVSVVPVPRPDSRWDFDAYGLGLAYVWNVGLRFFSRNLTLRPSDTLTLSEPDSLKQAIEVVKASGYKIFKEI